MEHKEHTKLYKSGKLWVAATIATTAVATGLVNTQTTAHADTTDQAQAVEGMSADQLKHATSQAKEVALTTPQLTPAQQEAKDVEDAKGNVSSAQTSFDQASKQLDSVKATNNDAQSKLKDVQADVAKKQAAVDSANKSVQDAQKLANQATPEATSKLQDQIKADQSDVAKNKTNVANNQVTLDNANKALDQAKDVQTQAQSNVNAAQTDVNNAQKALDGTSLGQAQQAATNAQNKVNSAKQELAKATTDLANAQKTEADAKNALPAAQKDLENAKNALNNANADVKAKQSALANATDENYTVNIPNADQYMKDYFDMLPNIDLRTDYPNEQEKAFEKYNDGILQNKYKPSTNPDDYKVIGHDDWKTGGGMQNVNITADQYDELNKYAVNIINNIIKQTTHKYGIPYVQTNKLMNQLSVEAQKLEQKDPDLLEGNPETVAFPYMAAQQASWSSVHGLLASSQTYVDTQNVTMNDLKERVYDGIVSLMVHDSGYDWLHLSDVIGTHGRYTKHDRKFSKANVFTSQYVYVVITKDGIRLVTIYTLPGNSELMGPEITDFLLRKYGSLDLLANRDDNYMGNPDKTVNKADLEAQLTQAKNVQSNAQKTADQAQAKVSDVTKHANDAANATSQAQQAKTNAENKLNQAQTDLDNANKQLANLNANDQTKQAALKTAQQALFDAQAELNKANADVASKQKAVDQAKAWVDTAKAELNKAETKLAADEQQLAKWEAAPRQLEQAKSDLAQAETALTNAKNVLAEAQSKADATKDAQSKAQADFDTAKTNLVSAKKNLQDLLDKIQAEHQQQADANKYQVKDNQVVDQNGKAVDGFKVVNGLVYDEYGNYIKVANAETKTVKSNAKTTAKQVVLDGKTIATLHSTNAKELPQTGNNEAQAAMGLGVAGVIAAFGMMLGFNTKRKY